MVCGVTESVQTESSVNGELAQNGQRPQLSLATDAARNLATTTKSVPQMQEITSRWLLRVLPWVEASGGTFRVNRRANYTVGDGRVTFTMNGDAAIHVIPDQLRELPMLRNFTDHPDVLSAIADQFELRDIAAGSAVVREGDDANQLFLIAHGKLNKIGPGKYGEPTVLDTLSDGGYFGDRELVIEGNDTWTYTVKAVTSCKVLVLSEQAFQRVRDQHASLRDSVDRFRASLDEAQNEHGEALIKLSAGHPQEHPLDGTFADYELYPREYQLSVAQAPLRVHTRVADLFNNPMNQVEEQLRLTIEALRERQEDELMNNEDFGLLHQTEFSQRISTRTGPPTPDDLDELLATVWKDPDVFLAHPRAIAAFGRECNRRGIYPHNIDLNGHKVPAWRGVPLLPCNKIPVTGYQTSSIVLMRTGLDKQGVIGLHQTGLPDEVQPGLNVRFMGIDEKAIMSYLVSAYYSAAVMVPDAIGILENVEISRFDDVPAPGTPQPSDATESAAPTESSKASSSGSAKKSK
ncbi:MAG: family 2B encapsulin nanocompartment shell protein [Pseudonocardiaceae bacterium]